MIDGIVFEEGVGILVDFVDGDADGGSDLSFEGARDDGGDGSGFAVGVGLDVEVGSACDEGIVDARVDVLVNVGGGACAVGVEFESLFAGENDGDACSDVGDGGIVDSFERDVGALAGSDVGVVDGGLKRFAIVVVADGGVSDGSAERSTSGDVDSAGDGGFCGSIVGGDGKAVDVGGVESVDVGDGVVGALIDGDVGV